MSQIGYMILGVGVGAYEAGVLHFFTHAFFKAQLFLGSGLIIHALNNEQDVRRMGGLRSRMPYAFWAMLLGTIAITGVLPIGGFFSKDAVVYGALEHGHPYLYGIAVLTAGITSYYMFRMIFLTFFGQDRTQHAAAAHHDHAHVPAWVMQVPVGILMVPTVAAGYLMLGGAASPWMRFLAPVFLRAQVSTVTPIFNEYVSMLMVFGVVLVGIVIAYLRYGAGKVYGESNILTRAFYVDDAIGVLFVKPSVFLGRLFGRYVDVIIIDGIVRDFAFLAGWFGREARLLQSGLLRSYAFVLVAGAVVFVAYFALAVQR
jgi:NADH-quinone oxidoreductase subunit L